MTEPKITYKHGGKRTGAGAKVTTGITTTRINIQKELVPLVKMINEKFKETGIIPELKE